MQCHIDALILTKQDTHVRTVTVMNIYMNHSLSSYTCTQTPHVHTFLEDTAQNGCSIHG